MYFLNVVGWIHFHLPGVFLSNPLSGIVNGQLWTVPQELHCYLLMAVLMILGIATRPRIVLGLLIIGVVLETATLFRHTIPAGVALQSGASLVLCFLCGQVFYLWRDRIPVRPSLFGTIHHPVHRRLLLVCTSRLHPRRGQRDLFRHVSRDGQAAAHPGSDVG